MCACARTETLPCAPGTRFHRLTSIKSSLREAPRPTPRDGQAPPVSGTGSRRPKRQFLDGMNVRWDGGTVWDGSGRVRMARDGVQSIRDAFIFTEDKGPYRMDRRPRGYALILSNTEFDNSPNRKGGEADLSNMIALFEGLSFETYILPNMNARGKPKLFFIQACRGGKVDKGVAAPEDEDDSATANLQALMEKLLHQPAASDEDEADETRPRVIPTRTDMLCCYPTQLGHKAFRGTKSGSWFIRIITEVFMEDAKDSSLYEMMTRVNNRVCKQTASSSSNPSIHGGKAVAEFFSSLRKELYFFPGVKSSGAIKRKYTADSSNSSEEDSASTPEDDSSDSSSDEYSASPPKPKKTRKSVEKRKKGKSPTVDVSKYFAKVVRRVSAYWEDLARKLGLEEHEIDEIERDKRGCKSMCWEVLKKWRNDRAEAATLQVLKKALIGMGHRLTAESLDGMYTM
ncbi:luteolysis [Branchiostoma belcheri]|nr:luteolysis [Branchiostoma belcheri]